MTVQHGSVLSCQRQCTVECCRVLHDKRKPVLPEQLEGSVSIIIDWPLLACDEENHDLQKCVLTVIDERVYLPMTPNGKSGERIDVIECQTGSKPW